VNAKIIRLLARILTSLMLLAVVTAVDLGLKVNPTTAALSFLIAVLIISAYWGLAAAVVTSLASTAACNFFFLPPTGTFTIADTQNWAALGAFLVAALLASNLAESARREAAKAITAEAAAQSERLRTALLDSVAHGFRSPLTGIKAAVTTLLTDGGQTNVSLDLAEQRELLTVINEEADRLDRLVGATSQMAELETSAVMLKTEDVTVEKLIQSALEGAQPHLRQHNVTTEVPPGLPNLTVDVERTAQALRLLLENAGKYSEPGTAVCVRAEREPHAVTVSVIDHGPGITAGEQELIFEKFFRGGAQRHLAQGSGMGLAIAKVLVEAQGGRIWVSSAPGDGSAFHVRLPVSTKPARTTQVQPPADLGY
jgi:K+-sensing histidine kinase KdpD